MIARTKLAKVPISNYRTVVSQYSVYRQRYHHGNIQKQNLSMSRGGIHHTPTWLQSKSSHHKGADYVNLLRQFRDYSSTGNAGNSCFHLKSRTLLRVGGKDSSSFLQGLITNDMQLLDHEEGTVDQAAMYAMMLNIQGRVLYDLIVYRLPESGSEPAYLLECTEEISDELLKTMKKYKIRKKVDLSLVSDELKVWAVAPGDSASDGSSVQMKFASTDKIVIHTPDPRLEAFGHRLLLPDGVKGSDVLEDSTECEEVDYTQRRYMLGLGEGTVDLPPANCFPLECNAVFLNGVSFSKGCYIGQELTARTHHTGVIRKRLMPITFTGDSSLAKSGDTVENSKGKNCGKFRNVVGAKGLALLRIADVIGNGTLLIKNPDKEEVGSVETAIPFWWPPDKDEIIKQAIARVKS